MPLPLQQDLSPDGANPFDSNLLTSSQVCIPKSTDTKKSRKNLFIQESSEVSISHKIRRSFRDLWRSGVQNGSTVNSDQSALGFVLFGLESLHGWRFDQLSGQPIPVLIIKSFFLKSIWINQLIPVASMNQHEVGLCLLNSLLEGTRDMLLGTLKPSLRQVEQTQLLQCLLKGQVLQPQTVVMAGGKYSQKNSLLQVCCRLGWD